MARKDASMRPAKRPGIFWTIGTAAALAAAGTTTGWTAHAELLQILHTNDLHGYLDHAATNHAMGGYPQIKATLDRLRHEAAEQGIDSMALDGGDFLEGSLAYLANGGRENLRAMDTMGYDAAVLGNHDWLMGPEDLDTVVGEVRPSFALLGANFHAPKNAKNLQRYVLPYTVLSRAGEQIAVVGLTIDSVLYSWRAREGFLTSPVDEAKKQLKNLQKRYKYVIALTHLGVKDDRKIIKATRGLDFVVGGHSHTVLHQPEWGNDKDGNRIPIVQAGDHAQWVGKAIVDLTEDGRMELKSYELVPVAADGPADLLMLRHVAHTKSILDTQYGTEWLNETIGETDSPLLRSGTEDTVWGNFQVETMREYADAEIALDVSPFSGMELETGPLTRADMFAAYPRVFDFSDRFGWNIWTVDVRGWVLALALKLAGGYHFSLAGADLEGGVPHMRVGGRGLKWWRNYRIALPEGIARGALGISEALTIILKNPKNTRVPMWLALNDKLKRIGVIRKNEWLQQAPAP